MSAQVRRSRRVISTVFGGMLSLAFLYLTFVGIDWEGVSDALHDADWLLLLLFIPVQGLGFWVAAVRSQVLLAPLDQYSLRNALLALQAYFVANNILPLRLGEFVRADLLARTGKPSFAACLTVLGVERILDLGFLAAMFLSVVPLTAGRLTTGQVIPAIVGLLVVITLAFIWVIHHRDEFIGIVRRAIGPFGSRAQVWVVRTTEQLVEGLEPLRSPRVMLVALGLTVAYWATMLWNVHLWFIVFDLDLPWYASPVVLLFVSFGHFIPSAPSGVGTYHFFCAAALKIFGVSSAVAASVALVGHAIATVPWTVISIPFVLPFVVSAWRKRTELPT